ncbi:MAG: hypothetical protein KC503_30035, partial [Myxococcales bacterium]|nr:hypothetical protein [Myxococcales bacterium]
ARGSGVARGGIDEVTSEELLRAGEQANAELAVARAELAALRSREEEAEQVAAQMRVELERLRYSEDELRAEVEALRKTPTDQHPAVDVPLAGAGNGSPSDGGNAEALALTRRQLEALLDGALEHKAQSDSLATRIDELSDRVDELARERDRAERELSECRQRGRQRERELDDLRQQLSHTGRELARAQGELKRFRSSPS